MTKRHSWAKAANGLARSSSSRRCVLANGSLSSWWWLSWMRPGLLREGTRVREFRIRLAAGHWPAQVVMSGPGACSRFRDGRCKKNLPPEVLRSARKVNTSSCLGLVKAMFCDSLLGTYPNLFLVAAANPYREEATTEDLVVRGSRTVMRDFFQAS